MKIKAVKVDSVYRVLYDIPAVAFAKQRPSGRWELMDHHVSLEGRDLRVLKGFRMWVGCLIRTAAERWAQLTK